MVYGLHVLSDKLSRHGVLQVAILMGSHDIAVQVTSRATPWLWTVLLGWLLHALQQKLTLLCA